MIDRLLKRAEELRKTKERIRVIRLQLHLAIAKGVEVGKYELDDLEKVENWVDNMYKLSAKDVYLDELGSE